MGRAGRPDDIRACVGAWKPEATALRAGCLQQCPDLGDTVLDRLIQNLREAAEGIDRVAALWGMNVLELAGQRVSPLAALRQAECAIDDLEGLVPVLEARETRRARGGAAESQRPGGDTPGTSEARSASADDESRRSRPSRPPLTDRQREVWDLLKCRLLSAKQIAQQVTGRAADQDAIRKRIAALRKAGYPIDLRRGAGYLRPDAPPPSETPEPSGKQSPVEVRMKSG